MSDTISAGSGAEGREGRANLWHRAYCRWYDHDRAGHRIRAAAWGWVADRLVRFG